MLRISAVILKNFSRISVTNRSNSQNDELRVSFEIESRSRHCRSGHRISKGMTGSECNCVRGWSASKRDDPRCI